MDENTVEYHQQFVARIDQNIAQLHVTRREHVRQIKEISLSANTQSEESHICGAWCSC